MCVTVVIHFIDNNANIYSNSHILDELSKVVCSSIYHPPALKFPFLYLIWIERIDGINELITLFLWMRKEKKKWKKTMNADLGIEIGGVQQVVIT